MERISNQRHGKIKIVFRNYTILYCDNSLLLNKRDGGQNRDALYY